MMYINFTQHPLWSQVQCRRSVSSKIFDSSQSVMKENSRSLSASWKVREFKHLNIIQSDLKTRVQTADVTAPAVVSLRWASVSRESPGLRSEDLTPPHPCLQRAAAGRTSSPSSPKTSTANTTREYSVTTVVLMF